MNAERELLTYINATPQLQSILYDTDLLPEQTMGKPSWNRTVALVMIYQEMATLEEERLRFYHADGTFEVLESPEEVTKRRIECAKQIKDLAALVRSLIHQVNRFNDGNERAALALDYLKRKNLTGSILR